jgi:phage gpG-like protein
VPAEARLQITQQRLTAALTGPGGMVTQYVLRQTSQIRNRAVLYCPVDTGNLRNSIVTALRADGTTVVGTVGTPVEYAAAVHEGSVTSKGRRTPGRPFLRRALQDVIH